MRRELTVRKKLQGKNIVSTILPKYYGEILTNFGRGYLFEYICDYDSQKSLSLENYLQNEDLLMAKRPQLQAAMRYLKQELFTENIVSMRIFAENILLRRSDENKLQPYFLNDLGSAAFLPLEYYLPFWNKKRLARHWQYFVKHTKENFPSPLVNDFLESVK